MVLKDQLEIYNQVGILVHARIFGANFFAQDRLSWAIWLYKDISFQGMVYVSQDTPYMTLFKASLEKKHWLAIDAWGADTSKIQHVYQPLIDHITKEVPEEYHNLYPFPVWKMSDRVARLSRCILLSEYLVQEWAEHFRGKSDEEIDAIAQSFRFDKCLHRDGLNKILMENASLAGHLPSADVGSGA